jgi:hypothetical protein
MSAPDGSQFQVAVSQHVLHSLENLHWQAKQKGWEADFLAALKRIDTRLREHPDQFGEPRFVLQHMNLEIRVAVEPPLVVAFGVHKQKPIVFIRQFWLLPGSN